MKNKFAVPMWQIVEPNGEIMGFMTVQNEIAQKLCEAVQGRKMMQVYVSCNEEQYNQYQDYLNGQNK